MDQKIGDNLEISQKIIQLQNSVSTNQQLSLVRQIFANDIIGQEALLELLINRRIVQQLDINCLDGILFEALHNSQSKIIQLGMKNYFENGLIKFSPSLQMDYGNLQNLLIHRNYQEADRLTQIKLCQLVGLDKFSTRNWLYFTDISLIPSDDLEIIDLLWRVYSRDKFGFSKQREIWLANNCNWDKLWLDIGWKHAGVSRRYPYEFTWTINAPKGHLPLFNQLRGVQVLAALFNHVLWNK